MSSYKQKIAQLTVQLREAQECVAELLEAQRDRLQGRESCWLIERNAAGWPPIWLTLTTIERKYVTSGNHHYTESAQCALKFHDKESADEYIRYHHIKQVMATEHIFDAITESESYLIAAEAAGGVK